MLKTLTIIKQQYHLRIYTAIIQSIQRANETIKQFAIMRIEIWFNNQTLQDKVLKIYKIKLTRKKQIFNILFIFYK